jgi:hypothetical protein
MADRAPIDYSYSSSGSTIEVIDLASTRPPRQPSSRISSAGSSLSWHSKLTVYHLLVILSTICLAVAKTATSYLNKFTFACITLEWILGVVVFLLRVLAILRLIATYVELVSTFSAHMRRPGSTGPITFSQRCHDIRLGQKVGKRKSNKYWSTVPRGYHWMCCYII